MKVVLDTNVLISTFLFKGLSASVYDYCIFYTEIYLSEWIIEEFMNKLKLKFNINSETRRAIEELVREKAKINEPSTRLPTICRDKDDNHILQMAESVSANFIVTGDKDLLILEKYKDTKIVTPRVFYDTVINKSTL